MDGHRWGERFIEEVLVLIIWFLVFKVKLKGCSLLLLYAVGIRGPPARSNWEESDT